jgi:hypothetical protein
MLDNRLTFNGSVGFMSVLVGETFVIALLPSPDLPSSDALGDNVGDLQSCFYRD